MITKKHFNKIAEIISGPPVGNIKAYEVMSPWQSIGPKYIGNPFINQTNFYQYAEVETPDTDEIIQGFQNYISIDVAEGVTALQVEIDQDSIIPVTEMEVFATQFEDISSQFSNSSLYDNKIDSDSLVQFQEVTSMSFISNSYF